MLRPAAALLLALLCAGCGGRGDAATEEAVLAALAAGARDPSGEVDLREVVDGDWTRLTFVCSYSAQESVESELGFPWPDYVPTDQDGENTWVFSTPDEVVTWARVPGNHGDPCFYEGEQPRSTVRRDDAVFRVEETGANAQAGRPYLALRPRT